MVGKGSPIPITYCLDRSRLFPTSRLFFTGILLPPLPNPQRRKHRVSPGPAKTQPKKIEMIGSVDTEARLISLKLA